MQRPPCPASLPGTCLRSVHPQPGWALHSSLDENCCHAPGPRSADPPPARGRTPTVVSARARTCGHVAVRGSGCAPRAVPPRTRRWRRALSAPWWPRLTTRGSETPAPAPSPLLGILRLRCSGCPGTSSFDFHPGAVWLPESCPCHLLSLSLPRSQTWAHEAVSVQRRGWSFVPSPSAGSGLPPPPPHVRSVPAGWTGHTWRTTPSPPLPLGVPWRQVPSPRPHGEVGADREGAWDGASGQILSQRHSCGGNAANPQNGALTAKPWGPDPAGHGRCSPPRGFCFSIFSRLSPLFLDNRAPPLDTTLFSPRRPPEPVLSGPGRGGAARQRGSQPSSESSRCPGGAPSCSPQPLDPSTHPTAVPKDLPEQSRAATGQGGLGAAAGVKAAPPRRKGRGSRRGHKYTLFH